MNKATPRVWAEGTVIMAQFPTREPDRSLRRAPGEGHGESTSSSLATPSDRYRADRNIVLNFQLPAHARPQGTHTPPNDRKKMMWRARSSSQNDIATGLKVPVQV